MHFEDEELPHYVDRYMSTDIKYVSNMSTDIKLNKAQLPKII